MHSSFDENRQLIRDSVGLMSVVTPQRSNKPAFKGTLYKKNVDDFGNAIFTKEADNTVTLGGAVTALEKLTGVNASFKPATLNSIYNVNADVTAPDGTPETIALFGVGIGGCALDFGSVIDPDYKQREIIDFIPMMTVVDGELTGADANKYFFKRELQLSDGAVATSYYLKEFDAEVAVKSLWKDAPDDYTDGTEITSEVYDSSRTEGIESFANFNLKIDKNDIRSYFEAIGNIDMARYNSIGLFIGQKVLIDPDTNYYDYVNVRLFSVVNINNDSVVDRKQIEYLYRIYAAV